MNPSKRTGRRIFDMGGLLKGKTVLAGSAKPYVPPEPVFEAEIFVPHDFQTKATMYGPGFFNPRVEINPRAHMDMYYVAGFAGRNEFGWLGTVKRQGDLLGLEEIFVFEQEVTFSSTFLTQQSIAVVATQLIRDKQMAKVNALKFWGHVHPGNSTSPSPQDDDTMDILADGNDWFLRGICGRNGRLEFTLFDYKRGLRFNDIPWRLAVVESAERKMFFAEQVKKLAKPVYHTAYPATSALLPGGAAGTTGSFLEDFAFGGGCLRGPVAGAGGTSPAEEDTPLPEGPPEGVPD